MVQPNAPVEIYQLHILLLQDQPAYLAASARARRQQRRHVARLAPDRTRLERLSPPPFVIRGKEYGVRRMGCTTFKTDARKVLLSQFRFRVNERFLYEYDFGDLWKHQIRFEGVWPIRGKKIYPVCVDGACASPSEDCGGPEAYMGKIDHHRWNPPLDELQLIADAIGRVLDSQGEERIRDVLGDVDALKEAVDRLETYERFQPARFDRRKLNRRLEQYAQGDEKWRWE
jgi:hypothetical protein